MADYDIEKAFRAVEDELMESMIRNMKRHRLEEISEGKEWEMWQALQLKSLEEYRVQNRKRFNNNFADINSRIEALIKAARQEGGMNQEKAILQAIKKGFKVRGRNSSGRFGDVTAEFFKVNDRKLDALIKATQNDFKKAEYAMLRMAEDQYRKIIFNAQVYANAGAGTYEKAVDMAARDFISRGINCIEYANGARHTIGDYAEMAIKTAGKRAYLTGEGEKRQEWGISLVIMKKRGNACPKCLPFVGKVLIDDVWSGGKQSDGPYMLMSTAISRGLYHPRCKDIHTTYFEGISKPGAAYTKEELAEIEEAYRKDQKQQYAKRQEERFGRLARYSLDEENREKYVAKAEQWKDENSGEGLNFVDTTAQRCENVEAQTKEVELLSEFTTGGVNYVVDNVNVKQNNSLRELEVAELLKNVLGGEIKLVPEIKGKYKNVKTPDYIFNGERYDLKELTGTSKDAIRNAIHKKREQADNFIIDITKCELEMEEINRQAESVFTSYNTGFVKTIILVKGNKILRILQRT